MTIKVPPHVGPTALRGCARHVLLLLLLLLCCHRALLLLRLLCGFLVARQRPKCDRTSLLYILIYRSIDLISARLECQSVHLASPVNPIWNLITASYETCLPILPRRKMKQNTNSQHVTRPQPSSTDSRLSPTAVARSRAP